jgi:hypothetical protein
VYFQQICHGTRDFILAVLGVIADFGLLSASVPGFGQNPCEQKNAGYAALVCEARSPSSSSLHGMAAF